MGAAFLLVTFVVVGMSWGPDDAGHLYDSRRCLPGRRNSGWWDTPDFLADIQHAGRAVGGGGAKKRDLASGGVLSVALVPNTGSTPAGTFYTVVYQLDDNSTPPRYSRYTTALHLNYPL